MNANVSVDPAEQPSFVDHLHNLIHTTVPHTAASLDAMAFGTVLVAGLAAFIHQRWTKKRWPAEQFIRVGFAAGPLPIYFFLPCLPFDQDLAKMFAEERLLIALAAVSGFLWTVREIRTLFADERTSAPPPEQPAP